MPKRSPSTAWSRPLAELVDKAVNPVLARQGFGETQIVLYWEQIVGDRLADASEPLALKWPPRGQTPRDHAAAILVIRVESGFALELQHLAGVVIERVNAYLGYACVDRIALRQGPVARRKRDSGIPRAPSPAAVKAAAAIVEDVADTGLREALARLGAQVIEHSLDPKDAS